jgi:dTDP-4-dehydrorhamnose reductase
VKVVVTGAGGQLGRELVRAFGKTESVVPLVRGDLDVQDGAAVFQVLEATRPDVVLHAAAMTNVDGCEEHPDEALRVNALGSRNLAVASEAVGAALLYVSTDYVFAGTKGSAYDEFDAPDPIQVYGRSKWLGEEAVRRHNPRHFVVRTSWLYGHGSERNFIASIRRAARGREELLVVDDQWAGPTYARDLAEALPALVASRLYGTYHVVNAGETSRAAWAEWIVEAFRLGVRVRRVPSSDVVTRAPRPRRTTLAARQWRLSGFPALPSWEEAFRRFLADTKT